MKKRSQNDCENVYEIKKQVCVRELNYQNKLYKPT